MVISLNFMRIGNLFSLILSNSALDLHALIMIKSLKA